MNSPEDKPVVIPESILNEVKETARQGGHVLFEHYIDDGDPIYLVSLRTPGSQYYHSMPVRLFVEYLFRRLWLLPKGMSEKEFKIQTALGAKGIGGKGKFVFTERFRQHAKIGEFDEFQVANIRPTGK